MSIFNELFVTKYICIYVQTYIHIDIVLFNWNFLRHYLTKTLGIMFVLDELQNVEINYF